MCLLRIIKGIFNPVKRITKDEKLQQALKLLPKANVDNLLNNSVCIEWANLSATQVKNVFSSRIGKRIFISSTWHEAPVEQIACLIVHESSHLNDVGVEDELEALQKEAAAWKLFRDDFVVYESTDLYERLERLARMSKPQLKSFLKHNNFCIKEN